MGQRIVIALGGNAILADDPSAAGQMKALRNTSKHLIHLIKEGHEVIITHGNGPQVGNVLLQQAAADSPKNPAMPIDTAVAMTQGSIGYWLQNALIEELERNQIDQSVVTVVTQVEVDEKDVAFEHPTKPIGPFYTMEEADQIEGETNYTFIEDSGRGYRRVVPSPEPVDIVEFPVIKNLVESGVIVISAGGGGIPVQKTDYGYIGLEAVIDKDFASAKLAELMEADALIILTAVTHVYINFNQPNQEKLTEVNAKQLEEWIQEEQFGVGSMLPKIKAAKQFVENSKKESRAIITSLENLEHMLEPGQATVITK